MAKTEQKTYRLSSETVYQIDQLAHRWSVIVPLSAAAIVAECVRRAYSEQAYPDPPEPKRRKKSQ